jgi:predicted ATPase
MAGSARARGVPTGALRRLKVSGYRSIRDLDLDLGPINVVVGPNGCGKTNLYRSLYLLAAGASGTLARTLAEEGGIPSVVWAGPRKKEAVRIDVAVEMEDFHFEISCGPVPPVPGEPHHFLLDPEVKEERAFVVDGKRRHLVLERKDRTAFLRDAEGTRVMFPGDLWSNESVLSQLAEPHRFPVLSALRGEFLAWRFYHHFRTDADAPLRQPQIGIRTPVLHHDGRDLAAALQTILIIGDAEALAEHLDRAFPGAKLEIEAVDGRFRTLLHMPTLMRPLDARELSDGTLRYLCLLAALLSPRPPPLLALNEPETSLHPDLLFALAGLLEAASKHSQLWVTTHSEELARELKRLTRSEPIRLEKKDAATTLASIDPEAE